MKISERLLSAWRRPWPWRVRLWVGPGRARPAAEQPAADALGFVPTQPVVLRGEAAPLNAPQR